METVTETLSSYEKPQDKHILENDVDVDIPNHDEDSISVHSNGNEINDTNIDVSTNSPNSEFLERKEDEQHCDETEPNTKSKIDCDNLDENSHHNHKNVSSESVIHLSDEEEHLSDNEKEVASSLASNVEQDEASSITKIILDEEVHDTEDRNENEPFSLEEEKNKNEPLLLEEDKNNENDKDGDDKEVLEKDDKEEGENDVVEIEDKNSENEKDADNKEDSEKLIEENDENDIVELVENENKKDANSKDLIRTDEEKGENDIIEIEDENENEKDGDNKGDSEKGDEQKDVENNDKTAEELKEYPLLKETLTKRKEGSIQDKDESETGGDDLDMDEDFDPSLLCPDIAMEVDEAPVITNIDNVPSDGNKSPLLYEQMFSTYVDEMTGAEVSFDLTADEQRLRQELYGEHNLVQFTKVHCTACNIHLGSALDGQGNRFVHPLLKVLICKNCYHFYTSGEFEKDEDGSELYCRWCGQGGQVLCCSSCEMVFCKKCIRINFGRRKLTEIRDSDDWFCFRCNPVQLTDLRVHCAEFMEYVRREISRAATLENSATFMTTDYTQCCVVQKKRIGDTNTPDSKKKRKKSVDPDYDPERDLPPKEDEPIMELNCLPLKTVTLLPKQLNSNAGVVMRTPSPGTVYKVGNTTFRPRTMQLNQIRPSLQVGQNNMIGVRPQNSGPGYIKIMPGGLRVTRGPAPTFSSAHVRPQSNFSPRQVRPMVPNDAVMKHEWFEKTVRAAARVNSNLSYTLTQLNRAQATATSVEALAVVHNKLQEILSTSINSLIQIRKNLRTEFIAGIKNIKFPPKPLPQLRPMPSTSAQDDDVIFVSPSSSPIPPPRIMTTPNNLSPCVTLTSTSNILKRNSAIIPTTTLQPIPSTSTFSNGNKPKSFIRVKSLSALQSVPSECITIPDDPIPPVEPPPLEPPLLEPPPLISLLTPTSQDDNLKKKEEKKKQEPLKKSVENGVKETEGEKSGTDDVEIVEDKGGKNSNKGRVSNTGSRSNNNKIISKCFTLNLKDPPSSDEVKKMFNVKIYLQRSEEIERRIKSKFANGTSH